MRPGPASATALPLMPERSGSGDDIDMGKAAAKPPDQDGLGESQQAIITLLAFIRLATKMNSGTASSK